MNVKYKYNEYKLYSLYLFIIVLKQFGLGKVIILMWLLMYKHLVVCEI